MNADHHMSGLTCRDARSLFDAHLDGELSAAMRTELSAHRLSCATCRHELALLEVAGQVVASDEDVPELDADFTSRLLACVADPAQPRWGFHRVVRIGLRGLAVAACILLAVGYFRQPEERVAGFTTVNPDPPERVVNPVPREVSAEDRFQAQLERALTGWRRDASSLRKIYEFITPQIIEEMGLEPAEGIHEPDHAFEHAVPADNAVSSDALEIEDI
jgi:hypothetical protein